MPIQGQGWELHIRRTAVQRRADGKKRTVGNYVVYHDGNPAAGASMSGMVAESRGPGANAPVGNGKRIEEGRYRLATHIGPRYRTLGHDPNASPNGHRKPAIRLRDVQPRIGILLHPGVNFLSSIGCINPCTSLPNELEMIDWVGSRRRTIAIIDDVKAYLGAAFPGANDQHIPNAWIVIDGEPM